MILKSKTFKKLTACLLCLMLLVQPFTLPNAYGQTSGTITGFHNIDKNGYTFTYDMTEQDVAATLPRTIDVQLDGSNGSVSIDVNWKCVEDFNAKKLFAYTFEPIWDIDQYPISNEISKTSIPVIVVTPESVNANLSSENNNSPANDNESTAYNFFKSNLGLPTSSACAMLQNLYSESGIMPNNVENRCPYSDEEYTRMVDNGTYGREQFSSDEYGYGLCQWTSYGRKFNLYNAAVGKSIADMNMQLNFLAGELRNSFPTTWATLQKAPNNDLGTYLAASTMCFDFESPAFTIDTSVKRGKNAVEDYWHKYGGSYDLSKPIIGICGYSYPTKLNKGSGMPVRGVISTNNGISSIKASINNSSGSAVYSKTEYPGKCMFDLANFDDDLLFTDLSSGNYTYNIVAKAVDGKTITVSKSFSVGSSGTNIEYDVATDSAPAGPSISSSVYTHNSTILSWSKSKNPNDRYLIYRGTSIEGDWGNAIAELSNGTTSYIDDNNGKGLTTGKKYYYMMRTVDKSKSPWEYSDYGSKDYAIPNVPNVTGFSAYAVNENTCGVTWNKTKSSKMQYWIYRGTQPSGDWGSPIAKLSNSTTSYSDKNLKPNVKYYYMMRAVEVDGSRTYLGDYTSKDYGVTRDSVIETFSAKGVNTHEAYLQWNKNSDKSNYRIYRSLDAKDWYWIDELKTDVTNYTDKNLTFGKTYYYKICSVCYIGDEKYFGKYSKVDFAKPGVVPPSNVTSCAKTATSAKITWSKSSDTEVHYLLYRGTSLTGDWGSAIADLDNNTTSYIDKNLVPGQRYYYMLRGYCTVQGKRCYSDYTNKDYASPKISDITGFSAWASDSKTANASWDRSPDTEVKYAVYRGYAPSGDWGSAVAFLDNNQNKYVDKNVTKNKKYYYMMRPYCTVNGINYFGNYTNVDYAYPR